MLPGIKGPYLLCACCIQGARLGSTRNKPGSHEWSSSPLGVIVVSGAWRLMLGKQRLGGIQILFVSLEL